MLCDLVPLFNAHAILIQTSSSLPGLKNVLLSGGASSHSAEQGVLPRGSYLSPLGHEPLMMAVFHWRNLFKTFRNRNSKSCKKNVITSPRLYFNPLKVFDLCVLGSEREKLLVHPFLPQKKRATVNSIPPGSIAMLYSPGVTYSAWLI